ncbi:MAG TPA: ABC transporter ATP-binding protein [Candidatus Limnocylindria bacterium]|nr:ABC transporter ATP-binding protein [Candidatus Limnocylindria bacterium]
MRADRPVIATAGLTKDYGLGRGIFDLDLVVDHGEIFGFLGPNGAGKTTTIRLLMGLIRPTRGGGEVLGLDCQRDSVAVKRHVGYLPGELPQYGGWKGAEVVGYLAGLRGNVDPGEVRRIAERFELDLGRTYREYSRGNKQKLALVVAFMHRPELLILDEPTSGLDPLNQQQFHELVRESIGRGATVFLSSHVLSEVEQLCDRAGIVRDGRLVALAPLAELRAAKEREVEIRFRSAPPVDRIRALDGVTVLEATGQRVRCRVRGSIAPLVAALREAEVVDLVTREPTLEEAFLSFYSA